MKKRIYVFNSGELKRKENTLLFINSDTNEKRVIPIETVDEIAVFGELTINKRLLEFLNKNNVLLHFFNHYGYDIGSFYPREYLNSGFLLIKQVEHYLNPEKRLELAKQIVYGSLENIKKNLKYYKTHKRIDFDKELNSINNMQEKSKKAVTISELRAFEGNARRIYYDGFNKITNEEDFKFEKRIKRPPKNPINALISFGNSLMYTLALSSIYHTNLDPRIGFLHETNTRSFTLNLDIAEIFKPVITDRIIFSLINKKMISISDFESTIDYCILKEKGRSIFINEFENKLNTTIKLKKLSKKVSYRRLIQLECYKLYKHFIGEEPYKPFIGEW